MARRSPLAGIPLAFRLPNPPPLFVGRDADVAALLAALKKSPTAVIQGPADIGKTALALVATHAARRRRPETVRWLNADAAAPGARLLRALTPPGTVDADDWSRLAADPEALWTTVLDLAEEMAAWVVIDGDEAGRGLDAIARVGPYARRSRWLVTTRSAAPPIGSVVRLGPLDGPAQAICASHWAPTADPVQLAAALDAAAGVPGWLRRALELDPTRLAESGVRTRLMAVEALPDDDAAHEALLAVAAVSTLPEAALPAHAPIERLIGQGLIEPRPGGFSMHPAVRRLVVETPSDRRVAVEIALAGHLAAIDEPTADIDAVGLWVRHGHHAEARALLTARGERIIARGGAPALWSALRQHDHPAVRVWRMRAAVDAGDPAALTALGPPADARPECLLQWARALSLRGELAAALEVADRAIAAAPDDRVLRQTATRVAARALMNRGRLADGLARMATSPDPDALDQATMLACRSSMGDPAADDEARVLLARLDLQDGTAQRAAFSLGALFARTGDVGEATRIFDALAARRPLTMRVLGQRVVRLLLELAAGRSAAVARELHALRPAVSHSLFGLTVEMAGLALRMFTGRFAGLAVDLEQLTARAEAAGRVDLVCFGEALLDERARLDGIERAGRDLDGAALRPYGHTARAVRAWCRARHDRPPPADTTPPGGELAIIALLTTADAALSAGRADAAAPAVERARRRAEASGMAVRALQSAELAAEAALVAGRFDRVAVHADQLAAQAQACDAPRFAHEARWHHAVSGPPDMGALEALAAAGDIAPTAARRARALLGDETATLDPVDRRVLAAVRRRPAWPHIDGPSGPHAPGWGLDLDRQQAWLPDGRTVSLAGKGVQWSLLMGLVQGLEDKEALSGWLWPEDDYHPLRHGNRLQATIKLLRKALDDEQQTRIHTTADGYRLGGPLRLARIPAVPTTT